MTAQQEWLAVFGSAPDALRAVGQSLHEQVLQQQPQSVVVAYPGYHSVSYGFGRKKNAEAYLYLMAQKDRCNLGFYRGAALDDPGNLLEGTGKDMRHVKVRDQFAAENPMIADLIVAAIAERKTELGLG